MKFDRKLTRATVPMCECGRELVVAKTWGGLPLYSCDCQHKYTTPYCLGIYAPDAVGVVVDASIVGEVVGMLRERAVACKGHRLSDRAKAFYRLADELEKAND